MSNEELNKKAQFTKVSEEQQKRIDQIRELMSDVYNKIDVICKPSRETSIVYTKLEEAQFWAIKGITREMKIIKEEVIEDE